MKRLSLLRGSLRIAFVVAIVLAGTVPLVADGLPGEYLLTQRWRELHAPYSPVTNPALMTEENYLSVRATLSPTMLGAFKLWEIGAVYPIGLHQSVGLTWLGEDDGQVEVAQFDPSTKIMTPTGATVSNLNSFAVLSYAISPWDRLSVGANLNFAHQTNFGDPLMGIGLDLGITYRIMNHPAFGDHVVGLSALNLLPPSMSKSMAPDLGNSGAYARNLKFNWIARLLENRIINVIDINFKDFLANADEFVKDLSDPTDPVEGAPKIEFDLTERVGVWLFKIFTIDAIFGFDENIMDHWGLAAGVNMPSLFQGRDLAATYQYNYVLAEDLASTHSIYIRAQFGHHREEAYARQLSRLLDASPNDLYNKALGLYYNGKYWDAFFVFGQILGEFPDFFKNDWVTYYLNSCREAMDMRTSAYDGYEDVTRSYSASEAVPHANLGMMRIAYRQGDHPLVASQFSKLVQLGVPDSLKYHAFYLMGESLIKENNWPKAVQYLSSVPPEHPDYLFAQHSLAIAHMINSYHAGALDAFQNVFDAQAETPYQKEILNRSFLLIGYYFYESAALPKAVAALRKVDPSSYYYEDALLGLSWAAAKAAQWDDCIASAEKLITVSRKPVLQSEGALLAGYAHLSKKNLVASRTILEQGKKKMASYTAPVEDTLSSREWKYRNNRIAYHQLAQKSYDLALSSSSVLALQMIDSLHTEQQSLKNDLDRFLSFEIEFDRKSFFSHNADNVRADIEYALAVVEKLDLTRDDRKDLQQQQELERQIEKIKQEMEQLEGSQ